MQSLRKIVEMQLVKVPHFPLDAFQEGVLDNLHLEFFLEKCRVLITPGNDILLTGDAAEKEIDDFYALINANKETIDKLKWIVLYDLSVYSALLETNSYYITSNNHLLIARFVPYGDEPDKFELKLYTIARTDLPHNYKDKIYIGRDFISLHSLRRDHLGIANIRQSLSEQLTKMRKRVHENVISEQIEEIESEFLREIEELINEFGDGSEEIIHRFPVDITTKSIEKKALVEVNQQFRALKHILIEIEESVRELESKLFDQDFSRAVRYVTKFRKDITNYTNYLIMKVNGRISDAVNGIHL